MSTLGQANNKIIKNINTIKTKDDFEFVAIHYNPKTITEEQKQKIKKWIVSFSNYEYLYFKDSYIRFGNDDKDNIISDFHYFNGNDKKYTIIELEDFLCETPEQQAEEKMTGINKRLDSLTPAIINDASETWQKFTDVWNSLYHKAEKIKSKKSLELLTTKIKEL